MVRSVPNGARCRAPLPSNHLRHHLPIIATPHRQRAAPRGARRAATIDALPDAQGVVRPARLPRGHMTVSRPPPGHQAPGVVLDSCVPVHLLSWPRKLTLQWLDRSVLAHAPAQWLARVAAHRTPVESSWQHAGRHEPCRLALALFGRVRSHDYLAGASR